MKKYHPNYHFLKGYFDIAFFPLNKHSPIKIKTNKLYPFGLFHMKNAYNCLQAPHKLPIYA